jgi:hypothetical protein
MTKSNLPPIEADDKWPASAHAEIERDSRQSTEDMWQKDEKLIAVMTYIVTGGDPAFGYDLPQIEAIFRNLRQSELTKDMARVVARFFDEPTIAEGLLSVLKDVLSADLTGETGIRSLLKKYLLDVYERDVTGETRELILGIRELIATISQALEGGPDDDAWCALQAAVNAMRKRLRSENSPKQKMYQRWQIIRLLDRAEQGEFAAEEEELWFLSVPQPELNEIHRIVRKLARVDAVFLGTHKVVEDTIRKLREGRLESLCNAAAHLTHQVGAFGDNEHTVRAVRNDFASAQEKFGRKSGDLPADARFRQPPK